MKEKVSAEELQTQDVGKSSAVGGDLKVHTSADHNVHNITVSKWATEGNVHVTR